MVSLVALMKESTLLPSLVTAFHGCRSAKQAGVIKRHGPYPSMTDRIGASHRSRRCADTCVVLHVVSTPLVHHIALLSTFSLLVLSKGCKLQLQSHQPVLAVTPLGICERQTSSCQAAEKSPATSIVRVAQFRHVSAEHGF